MKRPFNFLNEEGRPDEALLSSADSLVAGMACAERFEKVSGLKKPRTIGADGQVTYADRSVQFVWELWQKQAHMWAEQVVGLHDLMAKEQADLLTENTALACNLRGNKSLIGATYTHLVRQRDSLFIELERQKVKLQGAA